MNAAFLLMSSAALAGADTTPPPASGHAPVVITSGGGCSNCGPVAPAPCGCGSTKAGLLDKLKAKVSSWGKKSHDCGCAPAPAPAPCHTCSTSIADRPNLFDKLKSRMGHKKADACGPVCDPCGAAHLMAAPPVTGTTPKEMPKPKEPPKEMPKPKDPPKGGASVPMPLPPVSGAGGLTGAGSPY